MSPDQPLNPIDALQAQLRRALDEQLASLSQQYDTAVEQARSVAAQEAEQEAAARFEFARAEFERRLAAETAARTDAERRIVAETTRIRMDAEQQAAESTARVREELEHALAAERQRAEQLVQTERRTAEAMAQRERERADQEIAAARREMESAAARAESLTAADAARIAERQAHLAGFDRLLSAMASIDGARSLTEALDGLLAHAASVTTRAALFLITGDRLKSWKTAGFPEVAAQPFESAISGTGLLAQAIQSATPIASGPGQPAPTFAAVPHDRVGLAVPILVGGRAVALIYADNVGPQAETPAVWPEFIETLARHASAVLALLTATRALLALGGSPAAGEPVATIGTGGDEAGARRYARLLVSEIKLYNEAAVSLGRQEHDLLARLRPEIDRARRLYEERVPPVLGSRALYFQQELVQTLADGDPALLGNA